MDVRSSPPYLLLGQPAGWRTFDCPACQRRWRYLADGRIEVDGLDVPVGPWKPGIDQWHAEIAASAIKWGVPAAWIAAVMYSETGGDQEAAGNLMEVLAATASDIEGRLITDAELREDHALSIDLGTKYIRYHLDRPVVGGDLVKADIAYNAGGVYCSASSKDCATTAFGIVATCPRPLSTIQALNVAIARGWGDRPPGYVEPPVPPVLPPVVPAGVPAGRWGWFVAACLVGFASVWASRSLVAGRPFGRGRR